MKEPRSLRANIKFVWGLIYNSRMPDAVKAYELLKKKMSTALIATDEASESDMLAFEQLEPILK